MIDLGLVDRIMRYGGGKLVLDGASVQFDAIQGLALLERDTTRPTEMEILGGFELNTENNLLDSLEPGGERLDAFAAFNGTRLLVAGGGKLRTDRFLAFGDATIVQGYVAAAVDALVVSPVDGEGLRVDGVLDTPVLQVLAEGEGFSGPGRLSVLERSPATSSWTGRCSIRAPTPTGCSSAATSRSPRPRRPASSSATTATAG